MSRPIVWFEISSTDQEKMKAFYSKLCDWNFTDYGEEFGNYVTSDTGPMGAGFAPVNAQNPAGQAVIYIDSTDVDADLKKVEELGGTVLGEAFDVPTVGRMGMFVDPSGNHMAFLHGIPAEDGN